MAACIMSEMSIEDPRHHPAETVLALRDILSGGATIVPDPKRHGFYEVHSERLVYYIHISPANCNVLLLATWPSDPQVSTRAATAASTSAEAA